MENEMAVFLDAIKEVNETEGSLNFSQFNIIDIGSIGHFQSPWKENENHINNILRIMPGGIASTKDDSITLDTALWDRDCERDFYIYKGLAGRGSSLFKPNYDYVLNNFSQLRTEGQENLSYSWLERSEVIDIKRIKCQSLDNLLAQLQHNFKYNFMILNVNGAELQTLQGAENFLKQHCIGLDIKLFNKPLYKGVTLMSEIENFLSKFHFKLVRRSTAYGSFNSQHDCVFLKVGAHKNKINIINKIFNLPTFKRQKPKTHLVDQTKYRVFIDTTNSCNLKCTFCKRQNGKSIKMSTADFDTIMRRIHKDTELIQLCCAWEYSVANNAPDIVRTMSKYNFPWTQIITNGNLLSDDLAEAIIESKIKWLTFSIGEAKKETYEKIRKGGKFDKIINNIKRISVLKKSLNSEYPKLHANLTLIKSNISELPDFVDLAHEIGIEFIFGRHLILSKDLDMSNEVITDKKSANALINQAKQKAKQYDIYFHIPLYTDDLISPKSCIKPWNELYISSSGDVSVCPRIHKYSKIGNLISSNLSEIRSNEHLINLQNQFSSNDINNPVCKICDENLETTIPIAQNF